MSHMKEESVTRYNPEIISGYDKKSIPEFIYEQHSHRSSVDSRKKKDRQRNGSAKHKPNGDVIREDSHTKTEEMNMNGDVVKDKNPNGEILTMEEENGEINEAFEGFDGLDDSVEVEVRIEDDHDRTAL